MGKKYTLYSVCCLIIGIAGGIAGTAFSMGADKQRIDGILTSHTAEIASMRNDDKDHEKATQKELDRFVEIVAIPMSSLQSDIMQLNNTVGNLRTDIQVLKAIMERMEKNSD